MEWNTIYVTGKPDFEEDVVHQLKHADFLFMEGNKEGELTLFWIDEKATLRDFKKAIGSKIVFKYRLRFYTSLEHYVETSGQADTDNKFTPEEQALIRKMIESRQGNVSSRNNNLSLLSA